MALSIYVEADPGSAFSSDASFSHPFSIALDGITGQIIEKKHFIRNNDSGHTYSAITLQPIDGGDDIVSNNGFSWKLKVGSTRPTESEWDTITAGSSVSFSDINDITTYLPFWVRIQVDPGKDVKSYQSVQLRIVATEA